MTIRTKTPNLLDSPPIPVQATLAARRIRRLSPRRTFPVPTPRAARASEPGRGTLAR